MCFDSSIGLVDSRNNIYFFERLNYNCFWYQSKVFRILLGNKFDSCFDLSLINSGYLCCSEHFLLNVSSSGSCVSSFNDLDLGCGFVEDGDHLRSFVADLVCENRNNLYFVAILSR